MINETFYIRVYMFIYSMYAISKLLNDVTRDLPVKESAKYVGSSPLSPVLTICISTVLDVVVYKCLWRVTPEQTLTLAPLASSLILA